MLGERGRGASVDATAEWTQLVAPPPTSSTTLKLARWHDGVPAFAWPLLVVAVLAVSSAATVFEEMQEVPPITLAAWRLQLTSVFLFIGAIWQWRNLVDEAERARVLSSWNQLAGSGVCLAVHFGAWVWGLQHTTLTHSLLLVCTAPLIMAVGILLGRQPISKGEVLGTLVGFGGAILLSLGPKGIEEHEKVSLAGDVASFAAAIAIIGYLLVGGALRKYMPIFIYAFPVTGLAALLLSFAAAIGEGASLLKGGSAGICGWLVDARYAPWVLYLACGPGLLGHTGFNTLLKYLTPLTVSLATQLEPLVGSIIGWLAGVLAAPGWSTYLGGAIMLGGTCAVTYASTQREQNQARRGATAVELESVFSSTHHQDSEGENSSLLSEHRHALARDGKRRPEQG